MAVTHGAGTVPVSTRQSASMTQPIRRTVWLFGKLEKRWNQALEDQKALEREYAHAQSSDLAPLSTSEQQEVLQLASDLPVLWAASTTASQERKRLVRVVIQGVTVTVDRPTRSAEFVIWWVGGATTHHTVCCPPVGWHCTTNATLVERIRTMAATHPDHRIAEILNARWFANTHWQIARTYARVLSLRTRHGIPTGCPLDPTSSAPRGDGLLSVKAVAKLLNVSPSLVRPLDKPGHSQI